MCVFMHAGAGACLRAHSSSRGACLCACARFYVCVCICMCVCVRMCVSMSVHKYISEQLLRVSLSGVQCVPMSQTHLKKSHVTCMINACQIWMSHVIYG